MVESLDTLIHKALLQKNGIAGLRPNPKFMDVYFALRKLGDFPSLSTSEEHKAVARINGSEWIVDCPFCPNAMLVSVMDPRFFCSHSRCQTGGVNGSDGFSIPVVIPEPEFIMWLEALLNLRPKALRRNWLPGESIDAIAEENIENGVSLDKIERAKEKSTRRWRTFFMQDKVDAVLQMPLDEARLKWHG